MALKPVSTNPKRYNRLRRLRRKRMMKKPLKNIYIFKRMAQQVQIRHVSGDAGDIWRITDAAGQLNSTYASGASWGTSALVGSYFNGFSLNSRLNFVENPSDFTNLYDRYKIVGVKVTFNNQISEATAGGAQVLPLLTYAVDYDDLNPPSESQMRQKQDVKRKVLTANKPVSIYYKPKKLLTVADLATTSNAVITNVGWNNCDFPGINHGGLKFYLSNLYSGIPATTSVQAQIDIVVQYYLAFKDPQ